MRILIVSADILPQASAVEAYVAALLPPMRRRGHHVDVLARHPKGKGVYSLTDGRYVPPEPLVEALYFNLQAAFDERYPGWDHDHPLRLREVQRYTLELSLPWFALDTYDVVLAVDAVSGRAAARVRPPGLRLVLSIHGLPGRRDRTWAGDELGPLDKDYGRLGLLSACRSADHVIVPYEAWADALRVELGAGRPPVTVIRYALPDIDRARRRPVANAGRGRGSVGRDGDGACRGFAAAPGPGAGAGAL